MKYYSWNPEKNERLQQECNISFEEIVVHIERGEFLDIIEQPNQEKYPGQKVFIVQIEAYVYLVPFVESDQEVFLKTIIPSRKATKKYLKGGAQDEQELLDSYERGEWQSVPHLDAEKQRYREYATATLTQAEGVNIRLSEKDVASFKKQAIQEGIPYQTLMASILHKYLSGRLIEKQA